MQIKNPTFFPDVQGLPATGYSVYIALANTDQTDPLNQLSVTDGIDGAAISWPYKVDVRGYPINDNGQRVNPYIAESSYSIKVVGIHGGTLYEAENIVSDSINSGALVVDAVYDNLADAEAANLTDFDHIYVQSNLSGWQDTPSGPVGGGYYHSTGIINIAGVSTSRIFYDAVGNEWALDFAQRRHADVEVITSTTLGWIPRAGAKSFKATIIGGGGGGLAGSSSITLTTNLANGGGQGGVCIVMIDDTANSYDITIGVGGSGGIQGGAAATGGTDTILDDGTTQFIGGGGDQGGIGSNQKNGGTNTNDQYGYVGAQGVACVVAEMRSNGVGNLVYIEQTKRGAGGGVTGYGQGGYTGALGTSDNGEDGEDGKVIIEY